jgi:ABC-type microcin C transport system duplicated ATPase subunit YejF
MKFDNESQKTKHFVKILQRHIEALEYMKISETKLIIENYPESSFYGETFRVVVSSDLILNPKLDLDNDRCFSSDLNSVVRYLETMDQDYYPYCVIFKVNITNGLSLRTLSDKYCNIFDKPEVTFIDHEDEIIPTSFNKINTYFNGKIETFFSNDW